MGARYDIPVLRADTGLAVLRATGPRYQLDSTFQLPPCIRKDLTQKILSTTSSSCGANVVMDCGAYIGTFSAAALEQGAARVVCYEAAPKIATLLRENMER